MNIALWIAQGLLAAVFLTAGLMKLARPHQHLVEMMGWPEDFSESTIKLIGLAETLGALGLVLPGVVDITTILTPLAAVGLAVVQALASGVHYRRGEKPMIVGNLVLIAIAAFIAWGRFGDYPLN